MQSSVGRHDDQRQVIFAFDLHMKRARRVIKAKRDYGIAMPGGFHGRGYAPDVLRIKSDCGRCLRRNNAAIVRKCAVNAKK